MATNSDPHYYYYSPNPSYSAAFQADGAPTSTTSTQPSSGYVGFEGNPVATQPTFQVPLLKTENSFYSKHTVSTACYTTEQNECRLVPGWPQTPLMLPGFSKSTMISIAGDVILWGAWATLLIFAVAIARSNGVADVNVILSEVVLTQAVIIIPTVFPILFAVTIGRSVKLIAMYRAEQGEKLGVLDQLIGSTTFMGTLITGVTTGLSSSIWITFVLLLMWALSPLGGQASIRSFHWEANTTETAGTFTYFSTNNTFNIQNAYGSTQALITSGTAPLLLASLISPKESTDAAMDLWANVKIPSVEALADSGFPSVNGWYEVDPQTKNLTTGHWSSLLGVPVRRRNPADQVYSNFSLETSYWTLSCQRLGTASKVLDGLKQSGTNFVQHNLTDGVMQVWAADRGDIRSKQDSQLLEARQLAFSIGYTQPFTAGCFLQTTYVETEVSCIYSACFATRVRESAKSHPVRNYTWLDDEEWVRNNNRSAYFYSLVEALQGRFTHPSVVSNYIARRLGNNTQKDLLGAAQANPAGFSFALAQILNTFWTASTGSDYVVDSQGANYSAAVIARQDPESKAIPLNFEDTGATWWSGEPIFTCSMPWLVLLFVAALLPLAACMVNLVLATIFIQGPTLSMNFTTLTRDNPYVPVPMNGSALSDNHRSRLLRNVRVRYGDVAGDEDVGHVGLGVMNDTHGVTGPKVLVKETNRFYA